MQPRKASESTNQPTRTWRSSPPQRQCFDGKRLYTRERDIGEDTHFSRYLPFQHSLQCTVQFLSHYYREYVPLRRPNLTLFPDFVAELLLGAWAIYANTMGSITPKGMTTVAPPLRVIFIRGDPFGNTVIRQNFNLFFMKGCFSIDHP